MIATNQELLTTTEAAVVASVSVRNVNRAIDERILPEHFFMVDQDGARRLKAGACVFLSFYFEAANRLTAEERLRIIATASKQLPDAEPSALEEEWPIREGFLTVDLAPFLRAVRERQAKLDAARALVVEDPDILSGTPVIRGTRVPAYDVAGLASAGEPMERILEDYPSLTSETVELAQLYAQANPFRGRPIGPLLLPPGTTIVASYSFPADRPEIQRLAS